MNPAYQLKRFVSDCRLGVSKTYVSKIAMDTARSDFNLNTQEEVLGFIGNGGLESPRLIISKHRENDYDSQNPIMVDAYGFYSGFIYGYIAFFQAATKKWIIKSFKKNREPDTRNLPFKETLSKLLNR